MNELYNNLYSNLYKYFTTTKEIICFVVETTGFSSEKDDIIQISAIKIYIENGKPSKIKGILNEYIKTNKKIEELNDKKLDNKVEYYILKSDITKIIGLKKVKNILKRDLKAENKKDIIFILLDIYENIFITLNKNQKENMAIFIGNQIFN